MKSIIHEAVATARAQPAPSVLTILIVMAMVLTVMMTTGRTVAAERQVLASIDDVGTRAIQIRADGAAGVTNDVLDRIRPMEGIEWSAALTNATDATNSRNLDGTRVPVRFIYSDHLNRLGIDIDSLADVGSTVFASEMAIEQWGLRDQAGAVVLTTGPTLTFGGQLDLPSYLEDLEPAALVPARPSASGQTVNRIVILAERPELVGPLASAVVSVLAPLDPASVSVETSESLAELRGLVESQLGASSRLLVLALLTITAALVSALLYGLVLMRRKDYGRRRALGATRRFIVGLLVTQTALLAAVGVVAGLAVSVVVAWSLGDPIPDWRFVVALSVLSLSASLVAALAPAIAASRREPIRELRVP